MIAENTFLNTKNNAKYGLLLLTFLALLLRLPYWKVIPASFDEVNQTVYALLIAQKQLLPLVGNDAYAGPFYFYLLAGLLRLGITNPMLGRAVIMVAGTLTVPATFGWVQALGHNKTAALIAALLVTVNPDLILVNSHMGGSTFLLPFFTTLFLMGLTVALSQDSWGWLVGGSIAGGLALQSNPIAGLVIMAGLLWFLARTYRQPRLGHWWPWWPICAGLVILLVYSPVILYNLTTDFQTVGVLHERSYLWEDHPTIATTVNNVQRFSLQTSRQVSGVVIGDEQFATLFGIPLLYVGLMLAGLAYTTYAVSALPLLILIPFFIILPIFSSHYGFVSIGRFTTLLVPVWTAVIGFLLAQTSHHIQTIALPKRTLLQIAALAFAILLLAYPVQSLFAFYRITNETHEGGQSILEISNYIVAHDQGEPVYISMIEELSTLTGVPYVPHAAFLLNDIYHEFLPPPQILGRLYETPGPAFLILSQPDADTLQETVPLERLAIPANEEARLQNYGLYKFNATAPLPKPEFVLTPKEIPAGLGPTAVFGAGIQLLGCATPQIAPSGNQLSFACYWQTLTDIPRDDYIGFAHLMDTDTATLVAQDDHILGEERYPVMAWQSDEVIQENYTFDISNREIAGTYQIVLGIYTWPDIVRLPVPETPDNLVPLPPVTIPSSR